MPKLVRDHIVDIIAKHKGGEPKWHVATKSEYHSRLRDKLQEEVNEYLEYENPEELADILEVIYALGKENGVSRSELDDIMKRKRKTNGGFDKRIVLDEMH